MADVLVAAEDVEAEPYDLVIDAFGWASRFALKAKRIVDIRRLR